MAESAGIDVISALSAAWFAAPIVGSIDKACTQNMAQTNTMKSSMKEEIRTAFRRPHRWITSWQSVFTLPVYTLTYSTVNIIDTYFEAQNHENPNNINPNQELIKVSTVTAVNVSISIWKDRMFARKYGAILPAAMPLRAYLIFLLRDVYTMAFTFTVPPVITKYVTKYDMIDPGNRDKFETVAQFTSPIAALIVCVYFHLWALDIYNRRELKFWQRQGMIRSAYPMTLFMFLVRCLPPFSIGPTLNTRFRRGLKQRQSTETNVAQDTLM